MSIFWRIDPLLCKDLEASNESFAVAMQKRGKLASTAIELPLEAFL
jgi:3-oxoacyl-[acyl-carrier-protein] synthase III